MPRLAVLLGFFCFVPLCFAETNVSSEYRLWRHSDGRQADLRLIGVDGEWAVLETQSRVVGRTRIRDLSPTDRGFLEELGVSPAGDVYVALQGEASADPDAATTDAAAASDAAPLAAPQTEREGLPAISSIYGGNTDYYLGLVGQKSPRLASPEWRAALNRGPEYDSELDRIQWKVDVPTGEALTLQDRESLRLVVEDILGQELNFSPDTARQYLETLAIEGGASTMPSQASGTTVALLPMNASVGSTNYVTPIVFDAACAYVPPPCSHQTMLARECCRPLPVHCFPCRHGFIRFCCRR